MDNKQHSSRAIDDSSLENFSGGISSQYLYGGSWRHDDLSSNQKQILENYEINVHKVTDNIHWRSKYPNLGNYLFTDKYGNEVSADIITKLLS